MSDLVVGIDLGTTNTCASYYFNGRINLLENEEGGRITASYLFITEENKFIVGQYARHMADNKPEHAIYEVKRLIGRKFNDPYVQKNLQYFSYNVVEEDNDIVVEIDQNGTKCRKTPEELCAAILSKVKKDVESKTCEHVDKAVITVPAYFNMSQREATLDAANKAGFTVLKLLNEPTAAALSYYLKNDSEDVNHCIVYDLGGGTFDVAILKRNGANIDILAVDGDTHLGGHDFDNLIIDYVVEILLKQYEYNARNDRRTMRRLRNKCEEAKKTLSFSEETRIVLEGVVRNHDAVLIDLTRQQFEQMCSHLFERTIKIVDSCMQKSGLKKNDIKEVILSGGSTRIPQIQKLISEYFNGKVLNTSVNPDECVAEGAAIQAALFSKHPKQKIDEILISDVCPLSLGIDTSFGLMWFVIARNTPIPTSATATVATARNQQSHMPVAVYEGERLDCRKNLHLGKIVVSDLTPAPPGQCKILVTMNIDHNGILKVSAKEKLRDNFKSLTISYTRGHRSDREIESALKDATDHKRDDEVFKKFALFKTVVCQYCERAKYNFENKELVESYRDVYDLCISSSKRVYHLKQKDQAELPNLFRAVVSKCEGIVKKHNFEFMPTLPKKLVTIFCS